MSLDDCHFNKYATKYDPIVIGSIDGTDTEPHDRAIVRAMKSEYKPYKSVKGNASCTLFIGRLNPRTTQDTIKTEFSKFGKIMQCCLVTDIVTGKSKQYAFIEYECASSMERAIREMHSEYIDASEIIVEQEAERRLQGWKPRRMGGGFGGRKESGQLRFGGRAKPFKRPILIHHETDGHKQEFKGWCNSFTRTETVLTILEGILLFIFFVLIVFVVLHIVACLDSVDKSVTTPSTTTVTIASTEGTSADSSDTTSTTSSKNIVTERTRPKCTWDPSKKTTAISHYFDSTVKTTQRSIATTTSIPNVEDVQIPEANDSFELSPDNSDGEEVNDGRENFILALAKLRPPEELSFGCVLTMISEFWTVTAASCIEAIEDIDSLDSFALVEGYGRGGRALGVAGAVVHPQYRTRRATADLAAVRSAVAMRGAPPRLPTPLDRLVVTLGDRLALLGFGGFRGVGGSSSGPGAALVRVLPVTQCETEVEVEEDEDVGGRWQARHLSRGEGVMRGAGARGLCAGVLYARGQVCNYCAGSPLLRGALLLGVMAATRPCAVACEPALYADVAEHAPWLRSLALDL